MHWTRAKVYGVLDTNLRIIDTMCREKSGCGRDACEGTPHREGTTSHDKGTMFSCVR